MYAIVYPNTAEEYSNIILRPYHPALKTRKMPSVCEPSLCFVCCPLSTQHLPFFGSDVHIFPIFANLSIQHLYCEHVSMLMSACSSKNHCATIHPRKFKATSYMWTGCKLRIYHTRVIHSLTDRIPSISDV